MKSLVALSMTAALLTGCSAHTALQKAQAGLASARDAGAETKAPYEFYAAETYLQLAEHEQEELDLTQARIFAEQSLQFAEQARKIAEGGGR